jgi:hypothetical protein
LEENMDLLFASQPLYLTYGLFALATLVIVIAGYHLFLSPDAAKKREYEEQVQEAAIYLEGDLWVCTGARRNETGGKCGTPAWQIVVTRHGGTQRMEFCGPFWNIREGDCVRLRLRTKRDEPASTVLSPYGDVLVPERDNLLPP